MSCKVPLHRGRENLTKGNMAREYPISRWLMRIKRRQENSGVEKIHWNIYTKKTKEILAHTKLRTLYMCNKASKENLPKSGNPAHSLTERIE
jgi:hypothetical protein